MTKDHNTVQNYSKLTDLVMRIELILAILSPRPSDVSEKFDHPFPHVFILVTCFLRVTISLLCRSQLHQRYIHYMFQFIPI